MKTKLQVPLSDYRKLSDEELVHRIAFRREETAILSLYERYAHLIFGLSIAFTRDVATARSATESLFIRFMDEPQIFHGAAPFKPWLYETVYGHCGKQTAVSKQISDKAIASLELEFAHSNDHQWEEEQWLARLGHAISYLNDSQSTPISQFYRDGLTHAEIATRANRKQSDVCQSILDARTALKSWLDKELYAPVASAAEGKLYLELLNQTHCLSKRQLRDYADASMAREEIRAAEHHINTCALCSQAVDGILSQLPASLEVLETSGYAFIRQHLSHSHVQPAQQPNTFATPATNHHPRQRRAVGMRSNLSPIIGFATVLLAGFGLIYYFGKDSGNSEFQNTTVAATSVQEHSNDSYQSEGSNNLPSQHIKVVPAVVKQAARAEDRNVSDDTIPTVSETGVPVQSTPTVATEPARTEPAPKKKDSTKEQTDKPSDGVVKNSDSKKNSSGETELKKLDKADGDMDRMAAGVDNYDKGNYDEALKHFRKEMNGAASDRKGEATLYAARCYMNMGQKTAAVQLLEQYEAQNGSEKRTVRRLKRQIENAEDPKNDKDDE